MQSTSNNYFPYLENYEYLKKEFSEGRGDERVTAIFIEIGNILNNLYDGGRTVHQNKTRVRKLFSKVTKIEAKLKLQSGVHDQIQVSEERAFDQQVSEMRILFGMYGKFLQSKSEEDAVVPTDENCQAAIARVEEWQKRQESEEDTDFVFIDNQLEGEDEEWVTL